MQLARRECYYLYYEITGNGEIKQQIFCRGTTLLIDILACLSFWMVYDKELECRVHLGFRNQADRILQDIEPLLSPASDKRTTVEVSGHSLGGAVAYIIAAKLRKRGYRVTRTTAVAAPRFCANESSAERIESLLPLDNLRIENEIDFVPFLPPFGHHVGNKLYLLDKSNKLFYVPRSNTNLSWLGSVFLNCRVWEILSAMGKPHRVPYYISHIQKALSGQ
jgi:pimeloyl-ACP methyl ester carboxylesterase